MRNIYIYTVYIYIYTVYIYILYKIQYIIYIYTVHLYVYIYIYTYWDHLGYWKNGGMEFFVPNRRRTPKMTTGSSDRATPALARCAVFFPGDFNRREHFKKRGWISVNYTSTWVLASWHTSLFCLVSMEWCGFIYDGFSYMGMMGSQLGSTICRPA